MKKQFINPPDLPNWAQSFSQVVIVESAGAKTIYLSGQVSVDRNNQLVGEGDLKLQADQAFFKSGDCVESSGSKCIRRCES